MLALRREKSALIGGGELANIQILKSDTTTVMTNKEFSEMIRHLTDCYIVIKDIRLDTFVKKYQIIEIAGSGTTGIVYKIKQIEPLLSPGSNNSFAIKLTAYDPKHEPENRNEGINIDYIPVKDRVKAIYQGLTGVIDFAIYKYLGEDLINFLRTIDLTGEMLSSLIRQLHEQLYALNSNDTYHNDVKMENIVVLSTDVSSNLELSLIDYGLYEHYSNKGTSYSMCIRGCAKFLLGSKPPLAEDLKKLVNELLKKATSTDYVGFFNVIISLLNPSSAFDIYNAILEIKGGYTIDTLLKILCLLCYVSNSADPVCTQFLEHSSCISIVQNINYKLETYIDPKELFRNFVPDENIPVHLQRRILFLSYLYFLITIHFKKKYATFIHITKLPKLLWDLSCCLDFQFNLEQFNANFGTIFNEQLLVPLPPLAP